MYIYAHSYWDKGKRDINQDSLILLQGIYGNNPIVLACVCDGIGGLVNGEKASAYCIMQINKWFMEEGMSLFIKGRKRAICNSLLRLSFKMNNGYMENKKQLAKHGTTCSLILLYKRRVICMHIGDSRIYKIKKGKMSQITKDHTLNGALTKCFGSFEYRKPDIRSFRLGVEEGLFICSDGFYRKETEAVIGESLNPEEIVTNNQLQKRLNSLGEHIKKLGETDNISGIVIIQKKKGVLV